MPYPHAKEERMRRVEDPVLGVKHFANAPLSEAPLVDEFLREMTRRNGCVDNYATRTSRRYIDRTG